MPIWTRRHSLQGYQDNILIQVRSTTTTHVAKAECGKSHGPRWARIANSLICLCNSRATPTQLNLGGMTLGMQVDMSSDRRAEQLGKHGILF